MKTKIIKSIKLIEGKYDAFFIDLWGVVHNGVKPYEGAIEVLSNLKKLNKRYVLMSNAPRPSASVKKFLIKLKINKNLLSNIFTSGEAALLSLKKNSFGKNFYHIGPQRDNILFESFKKNKTNLKKADFILCTGFFEKYEDSLIYYKNLLKNYKKIKMVCTNPDLIVHRGKKQEYCAGKIAEIFQEIGGEVIYFGKPHPEIYKFCMRKNEKILVIGDNIRTDIMGANNMKLDSLLITKGIHAKDFLNLELKNYGKVLKKYKTKTNYYQKVLTW
jgi:HAD superfamily hydrolase (TIGR01459 family)